MRIYYNMNFSGEKEDSRRLLADAIDRYREDEGMDTGTSVQELMDNIELGAQGKPSIPGFVPYSISHSDKYWGVAFSKQECGLDIQRWTKSRYVDIASRFYNADEFQAVLRGGESEFFRIWARREALRKAMGESVFSQEESVLFDMVETEEEPGELRKWHLQDIELPFDSHVAICVEASEREAKDGICVSEDAEENRNITIERL